MKKINVTVSYFVKNRADDMHLTVGWLVDEVNLPLSAVIGYLWEDGDDMRMIGHEMRESQERHLPTLFKRIGRFFKVSCAQPSED